MVRKDEGHFESHVLDGVSEDSSFLEMLDQLNEQLLDEGKEPIAFDHDCREVSAVLVPLILMALHTDRKIPQPLVNCTCVSSRMVTLLPLNLSEPRLFPVVKDLVVNRSAFDKIIQAGGFITVRTGSAPDGNALPVPKKMQIWRWMQPNVSDVEPVLHHAKMHPLCYFTSAKAGHLNMLPQGQAEKDSRVLNMVAAMDEAGFGNCRNYGECSAACPKDISLDYIAKLNQDYAKAKVKKVFS